MPAEPLRSPREQEIFALIDTGFEALERGDFDAAGRDADAILALEARQVDALYLKGQIAHRREQLDVAQDFYERAILSKPDFIDPYQQLTRLLMTIARDADALAVCRLALARIKQTPAGLMLLCMPLNPEFPVFVRDTLKPMLGATPEHLQVWIGYQQVLHRLRAGEDEYGAFLAGMRERFPGTVELEIVETLALGYQQRAEEAMQRFAAMREKFPELVMFDAELWHAYRAARRYDDAHAQVQKLIDAFPDNADFAFDMSEVKLCRGEIAEGLAFNERRFGRERGFNWRYLPMPNWQGQPLEGKTILVIEEQGFGDCIMFGRYMSELAKRAKRVRYVCRAAIYPLFAAQPALRHIEVFKLMESLVLHGEPDDYYVSNMSVAHHLGIDTATAGEGARYLVADTERVAQWREKIRGDGRPLVGIAWAANLHTAFGHAKSIPATLVPRILANPDVAFVSLQMPASLDEPHRHLLAHRPEIHDFNDTMALVECLDAVVSVDTSVAHLAASMGKRTIVLSKYAPDWRWEAGSDGRPYWYPEVEVLRQAALHDWESVVEPLAHRLRMPRP